MAANCWIWVTVLFLSAIMHRKVIHEMNVFLYSAILAGSLFFEIQRFCYHGNVT